MTIDVIVETKRLVLEKSWGFKWNFESDLDKRLNLQEWLEYFENDKEYTWTIEYVTTDFIIMVRKKWEKENLRTGELT